MIDIGYYNGVMGPVEEIKIPMRDRAMFFGDGVYDVTFAYNHKLFAMDAIKESALQRFSAGISQAELEYIYNFLTYGAFRMVCVWLNKEEREAPETFARLVNQMLEAG